MKTLKKWYGHWCWKGSIGQRWNIPEHIIFKLPSVPFKFSDQPCAPKAKENLNDRTRYNFIASEVRSRHVLQRSKSSRENLNV